MIIGAIMSAELVDSLTTSIRERNVELQWIDPLSQVWRTESPAARCKALIVDSNALEADQWEQLALWAGSAPIAVIHSGPDRNECGSGSSAQTVIGSEEDLFGWLSTLEETSDNTLSPAPAPGRVVVVVGAGGAPGRTLTTQMLGRESSRSGYPTLLIDADSSEPGLTFRLGLAGAESGLKAALRSARLEGATLEVLNSHTKPVNLEEQTVSLLSGYVLEPSAALSDSASMERLLGAFRDAGYVVIVDTPGVARLPRMSGSNPDSWREETPAEQWFSHADHVVAVACASEHGMSRAIRMWHEVMAEKTGSKLSFLVTNSNRAPESQQAITQSLWEYTGCESVHFVQNGKVKSGALSAVPVLPTTLCAVLWSGTYVSEEARPKGVAVPRRSASQGFLQSPRRKQLP